MTLDDIENFIRGISGAVGLTTLVVALWQGLWRGSRRPPGRTLGNARILQTPFLLSFTVFYIGLCIVLWRPVPFSISASLRVAALIVGALLYFPGLALYLWGARTLGPMFRTSSSLAVRLNAGQKLITSGPFAFVRHPMYLGLQAVAIGGLLIFWNWTFVFIAVNFLGLFIRARREEQALAAEFGQAWEVYAGQVPAWIPRFRRKGK